MTNWRKKHQPELDDLLGERDSQTEDLRANSESINSTHEKKKKAQKALKSIQEKIDKHIDKIIK